MMHNTDLLYVDSTYIGRLGDRNVNVATGSTFLMFCFAFALVLLMKYAYDICLLTICLFVLIIAGHFDTFDIIIIIEHLLKRISLTVHQSSCRFIQIDMIINEHVKFNMLRT